MYFRVNGYIFFFYKVINVCGYFKCYVVIGCVCVNNWNRYWNVKMVYYKNEFYLIN